MSIYSLILIFPDQTIMAQSGNGAASESDVTSLGTGQELKSDDLFYLFLFYYFVTHNELQAE